MDDAIVRSIQQRERLLIGQEQAEALQDRDRLRHTEHRGQDDAEVAGRDLTTGLLRRASVTAAQTREALARPLEQIASAVKDLLDQTPAELSADVIDGGITLVGGGALLRGLDTLLQAETGLAVTVPELSAHHRGARRRPGTRRARQASRHIERDAAAVDQYASRDGVRAVGRAVDRPRTGRRRARTRLRRVALRSVQVGAPLEPRGGSRSSSAWALTTVLALGISMWGAPYPAGGPRFAKLGVCLAGVSLLALALAGLALAAGIDMAGACGGG